MNPNSPQNPNVSNKGFNKFLLVGIIVVLLIILGGIGLLATRMNSSNNNAVNNNTVPQDLIANPIPEPELIDSTCKTSTYTNVDYPDFSFNYSCNWTLEETLMESSPQGESSTNFNKYSLVLENGENTLTFDIDGPILDGSSSCEIRSYEKLSNTLFRVKLPSEEDIRVYSYYPKLDLKGSTEYNSLKAARTDITGDETFCYDQYNNYATKSKVISVNGAGVEAGLVYSARVSPMLKVKGSADVESLTEPEEFYEVLESADQIMSSLKY